MAFIAREKRGNKVYLYKVESYRKDGKVKRRKLAYIGTEIEKKDGTKETIPAYKHIMDRIILTDNVHLGNVLVLNKIVKEIDLANIIDGFSIKGGGLPPGLQLSMLAINYAINPVSLNGFSAWYEDTALPKITGIPPEKLNKDNLSSAMDGICREIRNDEGEVIRIVDNTLNISKELVKKWSELYDIDMDALYYDLTSTYFEGAKCILAKLGYSRDKKKGKVQINIALVVTRKWRFPICSIVYPGNRSDQKTVKDILETIREEFGIKNCTIIWDRGMVSKANIRRVDRCHQRIISGLKGSEIEVKDILKSVKNEDLLKNGNKVRELENGEGIYAVALIKKVYNKRRKIVVYLNTQTQKRVHERRDARLRSAWIKLGKYRKKLKRGNYQKIVPVTNHVKECVRGVSKFFKPDYHQDGKITFDWIEHKNKIIEAEELDGKYCLMSTDLSIECNDIVDAYFEKDEIEKAFRYMKQVTKLHPTRCWLENHVRMHVFVCYLAYLLSKILEYKLRSSGLTITSEKALKEVGKIKQGVLIDPTTECSVMKVARCSKIQKEIIDRLGLSGYINSET
ncbi:MAG: IS1634 family transposase [Candidatus Thermoplasmatota archaeon]|jgi:transposase|nr:IS1634 family transposase [Candidatus Thermoplasmatota archaeon]